MGFHHTLPSSLSMYFQSDAYQATGCYNLLCSGFIQVNSEIAMGASISPVSAYRNSQYDISILVWKVKAKASLLRALDKILGPPFKIIWILGPFFKIIWFREGVKANGAWCCQGWVHVSINGDCPFHMDSFQIDPWQTWQPNKYLHKRVGSQRHHCSSDAKNLLPFCFEHSL